MGKLEDLEVDIHFFCHHIICQYLPSPLHNKSKCPFDEIYRGSSSRIASVARNGVCQRGELGKLHHLVMIGWEGVSWKYSFGLILW